MINCASMIKEREQSKKYMSMVSAKFNAVDFTNWLQNPVWLETGAYMDGK